MAKKDAQSLPAKLTVKGGGKAPSNDVEHVVHAAKAITLATGEGFVRRGQITLFLTTVVKAAESAGAARGMIEEAYNQGYLKGLEPAAPKAKAKSKARTKKAA